jgi:hypothetical protein
LAGELTISLVPVDDAQPELTSSLREKSGTDHEQSHLLAPDWLGGVDE